MRIFTSELPYCCVMSGLPWAEMFISQSFWASGYLGNGRVAGAQGHKQSSFSTPSSSLCLSKGESGGEAQPT